MTSVCIWRHRAFALAPVSERISCAYEKAYDSRPGPRGVGSMFTFLGAQGKDQGINRFYLRINTATPTYTNTHAHGGQGESLVPSHTR